MERGKFIVIYGANNLGKTEQANRLSARLNQEGIYTSYLKYPIYDLDPTGSAINKLLRGGESNVDFYNLQKLFARNRRDYEPQLTERLENEWIVAEDYKGTGIIWGRSHGLSLMNLEILNSGMKEEDLAIVLDGERFTIGIESVHLHERGDRWGRARRAFRELAPRYGWEIVNANQDRVKVAEDIFGLVERRLLKTK